MKHETPRSPAVLSPRVRRRPEVLAPAGDAEALRAALQAGADAVYFGLDEGFNARGRARNFAVADLRGVVASIHRAGARAYLTLNTVVFEAELPVMERLVREAARAGVDAVLVQDPAVALLAARVCPELELHASTQMTVSSPEAAAFARTLGIRRIVTPRELSVTEIRRLVEGTDLEVEVFALGALCVSWSGQCLSSEAWGGRSANRGLCAQACRLPYDLVVDGRIRPLGDRAYLLSPRDLAGFRAVPLLMEMGVHGLKVEGRQKGPGYVFAAVGAMRRWVDALCRPGGGNETDVRRLAEDVRDLAVSYSRGFGDGFLAGNDHQTLVEGRFPKHRGICLGRVSAVDGRRVRVEPLREALSPAEGSVSSPLPALGGSVEAASGPVAAPLVPVPGMGVVFDEGRPQDAEQGGPIFGAERKGDAWLLSFGRPGPDLEKVKVGTRVWVTGDPEVQGRAHKAVKAGEPEGRIEVAFQVAGREAGPLHVRASMGGHDVELESTTPLAVARGGQGLHETLRAKMLSLGGTPFRAGAVDLAGVAPNLFLPAGEMKQLRRDLVAALLAAVEAGPRREVREEPQLPALQREARVRCDEAGRLAQGSALVALCRTPEQLEAAIEGGLGEVVLDWMEMVGLAQAVERARSAGLRVGIATVRVQKPGEESFDGRIEKLRPDAVLVRHWAGVMHFAARGRETERPAVHGDFSLNVTNSLAASHLLGLGLDTVTAAHDMDASQLWALLDHLPAARAAVIVHHHIPTFHMEHCVYAHLLGKGRDHRTCGRPCEAHQVSLRDRVGNEHPVVVDVGCRNTVFNAAAQSAASLVPELVKRGVGVLRVEFVRETRAQARTVLEAYRQLVLGRITPAEVVRRVGVHEQFGVTAGTMELMEPG